MKRIRNLGLAALTVLTVTAVGGAASASATPGFQAEEYPATLKGEIKGSGEITPHSLEFPSVGLNVKCKTATYSGTLPAQSMTLNTTPSYSECIAHKGGLEPTASINMNGCFFTFRSDSNAMDIECPAGKAIEITFGTCKVIVSAQSSISEIEAELYKSPGTWEKTEFIIYWDDMSTMDYKAVDNFFCPFNGNSEHSDGGFGGVTELEARQSGGWKKQISIWAE